MRILKKIAWPAFMALLITGIDIAYRKSGKGMTGDDQGIPLSWVDLAAYHIEFVVVFFVTLGGALLYRRAVKNENNYTCPQCIQAFSHHGFSVAKCPECKIKGEPTKGFNDRHPEQKNRQR